MSQQIVLASISPFASSRPDSGHYYWMYKFLQDAQGDNHQPLTVTVMNQRGSHLLSLLSEDRPKHRIHTGSAKSLRHDMEALWAWLSSPEAERVTHVQSYDGTLRELYLMYFLSRAFPKTVFIYNFHWAMDWLRLTKSSGLREKLERKQLRDIFQSAPANLFFSAETKVLAEELKSAWAIPVSVFPIFAMLKVLEDRNWKNREIDVMFIPQRSHELEHCKLMSRLLRESDKTTTLAVVPALRGLTDSSGAAEKITNDFDQVVSLPLPDGQYQQTLQAHRAVVLPYLKDYFRWGSSGKFNEAIAVGTFPFVPKNTAIATQSSLNPGIHHYSTSDIHEARDLIISRLNEGFPAGLYPTLYSDFVMWLNSFTSSSSPPERAEFNRPIQRLIRGLELLESGAFVVREKITRSADFVFKRLRRSAGALRGQSSIA